MLLIIQEEQEKVCFRKIESNHMNIDLPLIDKKTSSRCLPGIN